MRVAITKRAKETRNWTTINVKGYERIKYLGRASFLCYKSRKMITIEKEVFHYISMLERVNGRDAHDKQFIKDIIAMLEDNL